MAFHQLVAFTLLLWVASCHHHHHQDNTDSIVEYYVKLIEEEIAKAYSYVPPSPQERLFGFKPFSEKCTDAEEADYIIVGAGSAGSVIASRLSENTTNKILLLEAGGNETDFSEIPSMLFYLRASDFNFNYNTTAQTTACLGLTNRECGYPIGKGLGGSTIMSALMYARGNKRDYDNWANSLNPGWSYDDVLPYFKKSENCLLDDCDPTYHGTGGYLDVVNLPVGSAQMDAFIEANLELGRKVVDYNAAQQLGVARTQFNTIDGRRLSVNKAFLQPAVNRPNLKILPGSFVTKILINPLTRNAYGVNFIRNGECFVARANKEVIISAGVINSPKLLMLSGIGPLLHLTTLGIPAIQPLAVGENFQDHAIFYGLHFETNSSVSAASLIDNVEQYLNGSGPFTVAGNAQGLGYYQTKSEKTPGFPNIEIIMVPSINTNDFSQKALHLNDYSYNSIWGKMDPTRSFTLIVCLLHPKSRGTIKLRSKNPYDDPLIDPNLLSHPDDIEALYQGIQLGVELINTAAFKKLNATLLYNPLPPCAELEYGSKQQWYCQIKQLTLAFFHGVGTCKMGPISLTGAVVDSQAKVQGIRSLRVADASIIPDAISGHTNAAAIMIGEKVSDLIKNGKAFGSKFGNI